MPDIINSIAQTIREGEKKDALVTRLVLQAVQTGYTLGLADAKKASPRGVSV